MIPLPLDTRRALGLADDADSAAGAVRCESRSLLLDRYANPQIKEAPRNTFFAAVGKRGCSPARSTVWLTFLQDGLKVSPKTYYSPSFSPG